MELKRSDFKYEYGFRGYLLKFRGIQFYMLCIYSADKSQMRSTAMRHIDTILSDFDSLPEETRSAIIRIDALWGSCVQCGKPFKRNMRGRPRKYCKRKCSNLWHTHKFRGREVI